MKKMFSLESIMNNDDFSLENLEFTPEELEAPPMSDDDIDEMILELSDNMFFDDDAEETESYIDNIEQSVERLEQLAAVITKYGISAPIMEIADPNKELVAAGICADYENLSDVPVKNEDADAAIEGIVNVVKNIFAGFVKVFEKIGHVLNDIGIKLDKRYADFSIMIRNGILELKKVQDIEEAKFASKNIRGFSKSNYGKAASTIEDIYKNIGSNTLANIVKNFETIITGKEIAPDQLKSMMKKNRAEIEKIVSRDVQGFIGIRPIFNTDNEIVKIKTDKRFLVMQRDIVSKLGWKSSDVNEVGNKLLKIVSMFSLINRANATMLKLNKHVVGVTHQLSSALDESDVATRSARRYALRQTAIVFRFYNEIIFRSFYPARELIINFLQLVKAYKASVK